MENEAIKKVLDKVLGSLSAHHEACDLYEKADNINTEKRKVLLNYLKDATTSSEPGEVKEVYLMEGMKLVLSYRIRKIGVGHEIIDLVLNYEKYEFEDLDDKPFEKLEGNKARLICEYYHSLVEKKKAENLRLSLQASYYEAKEEAIKVLGYRKPIKYRGVLFQVYSAGYYGERGLQMQDAEIKEID